MGVARRPAAAAQGGRDRRRELGHRARRPARPRRPRGPARHPHPRAGRADLEGARRTRSTCPGVELPPEIAVKRGAEIEVGGLDLVCLAVPSAALPATVGSLGDRIGARTAVLLLSKGFVAPMGALPTEYVSERVRCRAIACLGGPGARKRGRLRHRRPRARLRRPRPARPARRGLRPRRPRLRADRRLDRRRDRRRGEERRRARRRRGRAARPERRRHRRRRDLARVRRLRPRPRRRARHVHRPRRASAT